MLGEARPILTIRTLNQNLACSTAAAAAAVVGSVDGFCMHGAPHLFYRCLTNHLTHASSLRVQMASPADLVRERQRWPRGGSHVRMSQCCAEGHRHSMERTQSTTSHAAPALPALARRTPLCRALHAAGHAASPEHCQPAPRRTEHAPQAACAWPHARAHSQAHSAACRALMRRKFCSVLKHIHVRSALPTVSTVRGAGRMGPCMHQQVDASPLLLALSSSAAL